MNIIKQDWPTQTIYIFHYAGFSARVVVKKGHIPVLKDLYVYEEFRNMGKGTKGRECIELVILTDYGKICVDRGEKSDPYYLSVGYKVYNDKFLIKEK